MTRSDIMGILSRDEQTLRPRVVYASDLIAFCDAQKVTIGPPIRPDGSGWLICFDADAFVVSAWDSRLKTRLSERCATLTEALVAIHAYEHAPR